MKHKSRVLPHVTPMSTIDPGASLSITSTNNDGQPTSTWTETTATTGALVSVMSALDATLSAADPLYTRPPLALVDDAAATANALSILFQALPSTAAMAIASEYSLQPASVETLASIAASQPTSAGTFSTSTEPQPTPQILLVPSSISGASSSPAFSTSILSSTSTTQSSTELPSATTSLAPVFTTTVPQAEHLENRAIAGVVSGVTAGTVLIIIAVVFLLRRRQQGKRPFAHRKVYPEVAWLYDPAPTPVASLHRRHDSGEEVLLPPRQEEMEQVRLASPERSPHVTSPLLPLGSQVLSNEEASSRAPMHGRTTIRTVRRSSASAIAGERRPLHAIFEESQSQ